MRLAAAREALLLERALHRAARLFAVQSREAARVRVERAVEVEDVDLLEPVALPGREVVEVVRGGHLDGAGSELRVDQHRVGDDGEGAVDEGVPDALAVKRGVARVVRVNGDRGVAEHRLGARRGDDDLASALHFVSELEELAVGALLVVHLEVAERRAALGAPVDETRGPVHQALLVQAHERLDHGAAHVRVHRELRPRPVGARAQDALLQEDAVAGLAPPLPHPSDEGFASEREAARPLAGQEALDDELRRDARMVGARLPEHVEPAHAMPPDEGVFQRAALGVPHVQAAGHVGRRHRHDVHGPFVARGVGRGEDAVLLPERVPARLDSRRIVRLIEGGRRLGHREPISTLDGINPCDERFAGRRRGRRRG